MKKINFKAKTNFFYFYDFLCMDLRIRSEKKSFAQNRFQCRQRRIEDFH